MTARPATARASRCGTTVLVTGFGPFPGAPFNPTGPLVARLLRLRWPELLGLRLVGHVFRTSYAAVDAELPALIARHRPNVVLMFGLASRTKFVRVETCARNVRSSLLPDVAGALPSKRSIQAGGPDRLRGRGPFERVVAAVRATRVPVGLSHNAGRYLCNYAYWRAAAAAEGSAPPPLVLFVHVPKLGRTPRPWARARTRTFTLADLAGAAVAILRVLAPAARR